MLHENFGIFGCRKSFKSFHRGTKPNFKSCFLREHIGIFRSSKATFWRGWDTKCHYPIGSNDIFTQIHLMNYLNISHSCIFMEGNYTIVPLDPSSHYGGFIEIGGRMFFSANVTDDMFVRPTDGPPGVTKKAIGASIFPAPFCKPPGQPKKRKIYRNLIWKVVDCVRLFVQFPILEGGRAVFFVGNVQPKSNKSWHVFIEMWFGMQKFQSNELLSPVGCVRVSAYVRVEQKVHERGFLCVSLWVCN